MYIIYLYLIINKSFYILKNLIPDYSIVNFIINYIFMNIKINWKEKIVEFKPIYTRWIDKEFNAILFK